MNRLSQILQALGNTLGADPSTLETTSKTLVGAINEMDARLDALPTITVSTEDPTSEDGKDGDIWFVYQ